MIVGNKGDVVQNFISEDDLKTFDGWLRYQGIDASTTAPEELETWRGIFDDASTRSSTSPKVGLMKLRQYHPVNAGRGSRPQGRRSLADLVGSAFAYRRVLRLGAARRSRLEYSHELPP